MITGENILTALYLMCIFEGLIYGLFPSAMKKAIAQILPLPDTVIQNAGLGIAVFGIVMIWISHTVAGA